MEQTADILGAHWQVFFVRGRTGQAEEHLDLLKERGCYTWLVSSKKPNWGDDSERLEYQTEKHRKKSAVID
jgi:hypothetical protein